MATKPSMEEADSKLEARNPKFETNPNFPNSNVFFGLLFMDF